MSFEINANPQEVAVILEGKIFVEDAAQLRERLLDLINQGHRRFIIDMHKATYIDSSGLGVLVAIHKRALENGGKVVIKGLQGVVKDLFLMTRLNKVFEID
ncbi:STAS domain-containing protein [Desulfitobacterium metallireducens]|uniref:Anti-sigma factor antagonist n=1 Tax=Desulfitobacterium metallireducens DSM 15288 TaxID=871968 RepID=W0E6C8_9FIRM|nr:STAS domain-containing protein [Desulfitobacterium metallireducens]AHF06430.1 anti-anti-sigma factor [Desulfitobacterium metallireducens DSM 15288]